jgi:hypothetical protein
MAMTESAVRSGVDAWRPLRSTFRVAKALALVSFLVYAISGGGRIVGSDEVAMLELSRALLRGEIVVPEGATMALPDGRHVTKNAAFQAVVASPLVALSEAGARALRLEPERRNLAVRSGASFMNALVTAVLLGVFYAGARAIGVGPGGALAGALLLGFTTPLWVYAKSFMAEPLQALGLLLTVIGASLAGVRRRAAALAGLGILVAVSVKLSMLPLAGAAALPFLRSPRRSWLGPLAGLGLALLGHAAYNLARFGTPFETGYGAQATPAAYSTPILVGLYGLLLSSGKGVMWFAPAMWLAPFGWRSTFGETAETPARRAAWSALFATAAALLLYSRFQHWAGDGSYGPRYLIPILPLVFLPVAMALARAGRGTRIAATLLGLAGLLVQIGGVSIYFGAQMREAGDYPYRLPLEHPRFMSESHFNPRFSPIAGHWRMLLRNAAEHARGEGPRISTGGERDPRTGLSADDQRALLRALDFWWLYLGYAGFPKAPVGSALAMLIGLSVWAALRLRRAWLAEARSP